jgi:hypothetical protein
MSSNNRAIPKALERKLPSFVLALYRSRAFATPFYMFLTMFFLYGPVVQRTADHNGFRYLLGPFVCPILPVVYQILRPFNPYRGTPAILAGMVGLDARDTDAQRLVAIFRSTEYRRFVLRTSLNMTIILFGCMLIVTLLSVRSLNWDAVSPWFGQGLIGGAIAFFCAVGTEIVTWGINKWAVQSQREAAH